MQKVELDIKPINADFSLKDKIYDALKQAIVSMNIYAKDAVIGPPGSRLFSEANLFPSWFNRPSSSFGSSSTCHLTSMSRS